MPFKLLLTLAFVLTTTWHFSNKTNQKHFGKANLWRITEIRCVCFFFFFKGSLYFKMTKQPTHVEDTPAGSLLETEVGSLFLPSVLLSFKPLYLRLLAVLTVNDWAPSSRMQLKTNQRHSNLTRSFESIFQFSCLVRYFFWLVNSNMFVMQQYLFISCGTF